MTNALQTRPSRNTNPVTVLDTLSGALLSEVNERMGLPRKETERFRQGVTKTMGRLTELAESPVTRDRVASLTDWAASLFGESRAETPVEVCAWQIRALASLSQGTLTVKTGPDGVVRVSRPVTGAPQDWPQQLADRGFLNAPQGTGVWSLTPAGARTAEVEVWLKSVRETLQEFAEQVPGRWAKMGYMTRAVHMARFGAVVRSYAGLPQARKI